MEGLTLDKPFPERQRLMAENAALQAKLDKVRDECLNSYDDERGERWECSLCGGDCSHIEGCPLEEDG